MRLSRFVGRWEGGGGLSASPPRVKTWTSVGLEGWTTRRPLAHRLGIGTDEQGTRRTGERVETAAWVCLRFFFVLVFLLIEGYASAVSRVRGCLTDGWGGLAGKSSDDCLWRVRCNSPLFRASTNLI